MEMAKKKKTKNLKKYPERAKDVPVTQQMLLEVRDELRYEMKAGFNKVGARFKRVDAHFNEVDSRFSKVDARFNEVDARFNEVDARFDRVDARFDEFDARFNKVDARFDDIDANFNELKSQMHQTRLLVEEQNARNRIVLDGLTSLFARQERLEKDANDNKGL